MISPTQMPSPRGSVRATAFLGIWLESIDNTHTHTQISIFILKVCWRSSEVRTTVCLQFVWKCHRNNWRRAAAAATCVYWLLFITPSPPAHTRTSLLHTFITQISFFFFSFFYTCSSRMLLCRFPSNCAYVYAFQFTFFHSNILHIFPLSLPLIADAKLKY